MDMFRPYSLDDLASQNEGSALRTFCGWRLPGDEDSVSVWEVWDRPSLPPGPVTISWTRYATAAEVERGWGELFPQVTARVGRALSFYEIDADFDGSGNSEAWRLEPAGPHEPVRLLGSWDVDENRVDVFLGQCRGCSDPHAPAVVLWWRSVPNGREASQARRVVRPAIAERLARQLEQRVDRVTLAPHYSGHPRLFVVGWDQGPEAKGVSTHTHFRRPEPETPIGMSSDGRHFMIPLTPAQQARMATGPQFDYFGVHAGKARSVARSMAALFVEWADGHPHHDRFQRWLHQPEQHGALHAFMAFGGPSDHREQFARDFIEVVREEFNAWREEQPAS
jgi:hypothetical protein